MLILAGADVNTPAVLPDDVLTPLMLAAQCGKQELVEVLLAAGADLTAKSSCVSRCLTFMLFVIRFLYVLLFIFFNFDSQAAQTRVQLK
jgi:hypothetical protein